MKSKLPLIARLVLGFIFFAAGLVGLLNLAPPPENLPERLQAFTAGMEATGYFMTLVKSVETICGLMLLTGFRVPLALVILAPVSLNIFLVHAFMAPEGLPVAIFIGLLMIYLSFFASPYRQKIRALFVK